MYKKRRIVLAVLMVLTGIGVLSAQTISVSGNISSNTTWNADTVLIIGNISVGTGVLLSISPGTFIEAQGYYTIDVLGRINAIGTQNSPIVFRAHDTTSFWQDTTSVQGGWAGINIVGTNTSTDTSVFEYCDIQFGKKLDIYGGNTKGGAINIKNQGALILINSVFKNNMVICSLHGLDGAAGGAVYCENVSFVLIEGNHFEHNRSFESGGAIDIGYQCNTILIRKNLFIGNIAFSCRWVGGFLLYYGSGGGLSIHDNIGLNPVVSNNEFYNNSTVNGMIYTSSLNALVYNNVVCNNSGEGITDGHQLSTSHIFNNTIANNCVISGGIKLFSNAIVYDNLCWGNREMFNGYMVDQINVTTLLPVHPQLFNNCVEYGNGGANAVYADPEFVSPTAGAGLSYTGSMADWSLPVLSPCINKGTADTTGLFIPPLDVTGNPRIYPSRIDIGAYENQSLWLDLDHIDLSANETRIFPNPGYNQLTIHSRLIGILFILYNMQGRVVLVEKISSTQTRLNTAALAAGTYPWQIVYKNKVIESGKWIKE